MSMLLPIERWLAQAREAISRDAPIPLIDDSKLIDMTEELFDWWMLRCDGVKTEFENLMAQDPDDIGPRYVALSFFYRLATLDAMEKEEAVEGDRREYRSELAFLVRLRDEKSCTDIRELRWEIVNACAARDFARAQRLWCCIEDLALLPSARVNASRGRLYFLSLLEDTEEGFDSLGIWDTPLQAMPDPCRDVATWIANLRIYHESTRAEPLEGSSTDAIANLREAAHLLEKALAAWPDMPLSCRLMLARSHFAVGNFHGAASHYSWIVTNEAVFSRACAEDLPPVPTEHYEPMRSGIRSCLVKSYESSGDLDRALAAATEWLVAFPNRLGIRRRIAELHRKKGDFASAYEWLRKEADLDPILDEDPNISIALALGELGSAASYDKQLRGLAAEKSDGQRLSSSLLQDYWPTYGKLGPESQEDWSFGARLHSSESNGPPGFRAAVQCFTGVTERELRDRVFVPFRDGAVARNCDDGEDPVFRAFLARRDHLTLGQMFNVLKRAHKPRSPIDREFASWLNRQFPWFLTRLDGRGADGIVYLRNRASHGPGHPKTAEQAQTAHAGGRDILNALHAK